MVKVGDLLKKRYRVDREIGQGGFARVFLGRDTQHLNRPVAIKVLLPEHAATPKAMDRFIQEANLIANFDHPHIMPVFDCDREGTSLFLVMPYLSGGTLADRLRNRGPVSLREAADYVGQVASALDYAHERKIIHRDVKPQNLLFRDDGSLVLADFGIAKLIEQTQSTHAMGAVAYTAPEQFSGDSRRASDVYSLGCVLFELLTGRPPFTGAPAQVMWKHLEEPAPRLATLGRGPLASPGLQFAMDKALAKNHAERYQRAGELAAGVQVAAQSALSSWGAGGESGPDGVKTQPVPTSPDNRTPYLPINEAQSPKGGPGTSKKRAETAGASSGDGCFPAGALIVGLLVVAFIAGIFASNNKNPSNPGTPGVEPTGKILFASNSENLNSQRFSIYTTLPDGSETHRLTDPATDDFNPVWSPDHRRIAFISGRDGNHELYVMNAEGSGQQRLTDNRAADDWPAWSSDGEFIIFGSNRDSTAANFALYRIKPDGSALSKVLEGPVGWHSWSPQTQQPVYAKAQSDKTLKISTATGPLVALNAPHQDTPAFSSDGAYIAFSAGKNENNREIVVAGANGEQPKTLTSFHVDTSNPVWSPDGQWIAFSSKKDGTQQIYIMRKDGSGLKQITQGPGAKWYISW
ncbi:MAG: protein kinase [Thermomicrobiales bacterium]